MSNDEEELFKGVRFAIKKLDISEKYNNKVLEIFYIN